MSLYLGVDGGGTACRAAVADASGRILGVGAAGAANIASDMDGASRNILDAARMALSAAGFGEGRLGDGRLGDLRAGLGLAGANIAAQGQRLARALPFARTYVVSDGTTAVMGALGDRDGIVAALGTGSVYAVQRRGVIRQVGGWGLVLGDEGSGAWIGRGILARALRASDGLDEETPLLRRLVALHGGADGVAGFSLGARPADFAALAPEVIASGDPAAVAVIDGATAAVSEAIGLLQTDHGLPVVFLGGLGASYAARLAGRWPIQRPLGSALDGALRLARGVA